MNGPYETAQQPLDVPIIREIYRTMHVSARRGVREEMCGRLLEAACADVNVELGTYDRHILQWLAGIAEPETAQVIAGIIRRAGETTTPVLEDPALAIARALTDEQRQAIVERFTALNPHWQGAEAADILDALDQSDSNLAETEPFWEAHPDLAKRPGAGVAALALIWTGEPLTPEAVTGLLASVGVRRA